MKNSSLCSFTLFIFFSIVLQSAFCQSFIPFLEVGAEWMVRESHFDGISSDGTYYLEYTVDSTPYVIDTFTYHRFHVRRFDDGNIYEYFAEGYFREDTLNHRVYRKDSLTSDDSLFYDFALTVGDSIRTDSNTEYVFAASNQNYKGTQLRTLEFSGYSTGWGYCQSTWIAGIGALSGPIRSRSDCYGVTYSLVCHERSDGTKLITHNCSPLAIGSIEHKGVSVFPNPATDEFTITGSRFDFSKATLQLFDIQGRPVEFSSTRETNRIELSLHAPVGIYYLQVLESGKINRLTLIKSK